MFYIRLFSALTYMLVANQNQHDAIRFYLVFALHNQLFLLNCDIKADMIAEFNLNC